MRPPISIHISGVIHGKTGPLPNRVNGEKDVNKMI